MARSTSTAIDELPHLDQLPTQNYVILHVLLAATVLLPFGDAVGDELAGDGFLGPVSLSCQFYGVEEDTVYVSRLYYSNFLTGHMHLCMCMIIILSLCYLIVKPVLFSFFYADYYVWSYFF